MLKILFFTALSALALPLAAQEPRLLKVEDIHALKAVQDPQVSPDGRWVAYVVRKDDMEEDRQDADIWMVPFAGGEAVRLTASPKGESSPRWSPDNRWLAFLSSREGDSAQVWLLDRRGGEAVKITDYEGGVSEIAWSPDGKRLALVVTDPEPDDAPDGEEAGQEKNKEKDKEKKPKPIVIRRLQFKQDTEYLGEQRDHLHLFDLESRKGIQITSGPYDDLEPAWSPDGRWIAFVSKRAGDPDASDNSDLFLVAPEAGASPRALTTWEGADASPAFSPDGQWIVYVAGGDPKDIWYDTSSIAVVPVAGGAPRLLTRESDRNASDPRFAPDGRSILFLLEDGGNVHLARVPAGGGAIERVIVGEREILSFDQGRQGEVAVLETRSTYPPEVSAVAGAELRRLTHVNDDFLKGIRVAETRRLRVKSADGTPVDAFLTIPSDAAGKRMPAVLRIHGGPVSQFSSGWQLDWQVFASQGYAVIAANPRGSSGYGRAFSRAIFADWGNKDFDDVMAAVDQAVALGVADPERLGVGGWSYGGILTNYVMIKSPRFKAGISGASETNYLSNYGTDHYQKEWEGELGLPWENTELWIRLSPFFQVEKIRTPLLLLCAGDDVNVPCLNSEQLYQALRRLGRSTELVIYPGQGHGLTRPSFLADRFERSLAWYDRYLRPEAAKAAAGGGR